MRVKRRGWSVNCPSCGRRLAVPSDIDEWRPGASANWNGLASSAPSRPSLTDRDVHGGTHHLDGPASVRDVRRSGAPARRAGGRDAGPFGTVVLRMVAPPGSGLEAQCKGSSAWDRGRGRAGTSRGPGRARAGVEAGPNPCPCRSRPNPSGGGSNGSACGRAPKAAIPPAPAPGPAEPKRQPLTIRQVVAKSEASVALIRGISGSGSGFVSAPGLVATNAHVIASEPSRRPRGAFPLGGRGRPRPVPGPLALQGRGPRSGIAGGRDPARPAGAVPFLRLPARRGGHGHRQPGPRRRRHGLEECHQSRGCQHGGRSRRPALPPTRRFGEPGQLGRPGLQ